MTVTPLNALPLAQHGDSAAIAALINNTLKPQAITAKVVVKAEYVQVMLEAAQVPEQVATMAVIREVLAGLSHEAVWFIKVYGREAGEDFPAWNENFDLAAAVVPDRVMLVRQGDMNAISSLVSEWLDDPKIIVKIHLKQTCLQIILEAPQSAPDEQFCITQIQVPLKGLSIQGCQQVKVLGREIGEDFPAWQHELELASVSDLAATHALVPAHAADIVQPSPQPTSFWGSLFGSTANAAGAIGGAVASASGTVAGIVTNTAGAMGGAAVAAGQSVAGVAVGASGVVTSAAMQVPGSVGYLVDFVHQSPALASLTQALKVDWLMKVVNQVDVVAAEKRVHQLQKQYSHERPDEIAHRIMLEKSLYVGGSGFASSLMPGVAAGLFAVDLVATTALQAEMVYQIACAYGLDLHQAERKGEVLAIFGLALGGNTALKAGLGFLRNVPIAGAVIGASTNAITLYAVGYAACRFYEAKINPLTSQEAVIDAQAQSEQYLQDAIAQQVIMDQILAHVVAAGNPGKAWTQILPELQTLNFSPVSLQVIAKNIQSPVPLEALLNQISLDFIAPLVAQCQKIAQLDGVTTPEEALVIETITKKLNSSMSVVLDHAM